MKITGSGRARLQSCRGETHLQEALASEGFLSALKYVPKSASKAKAKAPSPTRSGRARLKSCPPVLTGPRKAYFHRRHGGHGDFTEASGFSVHHRVLRVSVANKKLEFLLSLDLRWLLFRVYRNPQFNCNLWGSL